MDQYLFVMAVVSAPRAAAACSCPWSTLLSPRAGATDVPINAVIVFQSAAATAVVYDLIHDVEVPSTIEPFGNVAQTRLIRPEQPWAPNTTFEVRPLPFSGDTVSTRFTTGTATDDAAPTYVGFTSLGLETVDMRDVSCRNSCFYGDTYRRMRLGYGPPPDDTALLLMEVYREASDGTPTLATLRG